MTDAPDELLASLTAADPANPALLPSASSLGAQRIFDQAVAEASVEGAPVAAFVPLPHLASKRAPAGPLRHRGRVLAAAAAAVVVLVAGALALAPTSTAPALAAVKDAAAETAAVTSGRVTTTLSLSGTDTTGSGNATSESGAGTLNAEFSGQDVAVTVSDVTSPDRPSLATQADQMEARLVDNVVYVHEGDRWLSMPAEGILASTVKSYLDPRMVLATVNDLTTADEIGPTTIDGVDVTHFQGTVDLASKSVADLFGRLDPMAGGDTPKVEGTATVDLYIDADGLLRHLDVAGDANDPAGAGTATFTITTVFSDLGADIAIDAPADAVGFTSADAAVFGD